MKRAYLLCLTLTACASIQTQLPDVPLASLSDERLYQETSALKNVDQLAQRLMRVSGPIMSANTELCPKTRLDIGVTTHSLESYSKAIRPAAARELGAMEDTSILNVRPGSAADKAGLRRGDILLGITHKPLSARGKQLQNILEDPDPMLRIKRGETEFTVSIEPEEICNYPIKLSSSSTINAYANGRSITMTAGMMNFVKDDNELASIIGHELAHNTMGHIRKIVTNLVISLGGTRYTRLFESEADYVGIYYMARAGYDPQGVEDLWRRLALTNPKSVVRAKTHPIYPDRYLRIAATRDEINTKKSSGLTLLPNFKPK